MTELGIFEPLELREKRVYPNLSTHPFTVEEKKQMIYHYNQELIEGKDVSMETFAARYSVPGNTFRNWVLRLKKGQPLRDREGAPAAIDDLGISDALKDIKEFRRLNHEAPNQTEVTKIFQRHADASSSRLGRHKINLTPRLVKEYISKLNLIKRSPQVITPVRDKACSDPRMIYSTMVMAEAYSKNLPPELIWNWDATTFIINTPGVDQPVYVVKDDNLLIPPSVVADDPFPFAIKWLHLANAAGNTAPLVLIVGIESIPAGYGEIFCESGLNYSGDGLSVGYIVFCHNRSANDIVYRWFLEQQVIELINEIRVNANLVDDDNMPLTAFASCDGETIILDEIFNEEILESLQEHNIHIGKLSASCSGILQPLDRSPIFKTAKRRLKSIVSANDVRASPLLEMKLKGILQRVENNFNITLPSSVKDRLVFGILAVKMAINETMTDSMNQEGFASTGFYPETLRSVMKEKVKDDAAVFRAQGFLTEQQYADSGIPTLDHPEAMARDHKAISNQRAVLLTNPNTVHRRNNRLSSDVETHAVMNSSKLSKKEKSEFKKAVQSLETEELSKKKKEEAQEAKRNQSVEEKEAEKIKREKRRLETKEKKAKAAEERENIIENAKKKYRDMKGMTYKSRTSLYIRALVPISASHGCN